MVSLGHAGLPHPDRDGGTRLNEVDKGARRPVLDRRHRRQSHIVKSPPQQPRIDKLVREKRQVRIGKVCAYLHCAGGGVDFVIDALQSARRDLLVVGAIIGCHR